MNINELSPQIFDTGIILYGAGSNCVAFLTLLFLQNQKANILCVVDADENKHGKNILGIPIVSVNELQKYDKQIPILITPLEGFIQITETLENMQFSNLHYYDKSAVRYIAFIKEYLKEDKNGKKVFDFNGVLLPNLNTTEKIYLLAHCFSDTLMFHVFFNNNYNKSITKIMDLYMSEGPYEYKDGNFDVIVKEKDIVIDAGSWIGDFAAYAAYKGAEVYAFEPTNETFELLKQTAELNKPHKIYPVKKALSDKRGKAYLEINNYHSGGNRVVTDKKTSFEENEILLISLDEFVAENNIKRVDFIKADIEGSERDMLKGATNVLKIFAPKLSICTYHRPDDKQVLESIILAANPKYKVVHLRNKLFACVV